MPMFEEPEMWGVKAGVCVTCKTRIPGSPFPQYQQLREQIDRLGWTRKHGNTVCDVCGEKVRLWRDGPKVIPKIVLRKRRRK
jgi:hypothetical protein